MRKKEHKQLDMAEELFIKPNLTLKNLIVLRSKQDYENNLKQSIPPNKKAKADLMLNAMWHLIRVYYSEWEKNGGDFPYKEWDSLYILMKRYSTLRYVAVQISYLASSAAYFCKETGNYSIAVKFYEISLLNPPHDPVMHFYRLNNYGFCLNFLKRFAAAEVVLRRADSLQIPRSEKCIFNILWKDLGVSLEHQGRYEEAAEYYLKAACRTGRRYGAVKHLDRLLQRVPSIKKIPEIEAWGLKFRKNVFEQYMFGFEIKS